MILCQEILSSVESRERAARLRAEQDEARQREAAAEAEAARLRAEEEAQQRAAAAEAEVARLRAVEEAEAARYQWLQQRLVDLEVDPAVASVAAKLLHQAGITSDRTLVKLSEGDYKEIINDAISKELFGLKAIVLRTNLTTIQQDAKVSSIKTQNVMRIKTQNVMRI